MATEASIKLPNELLAQAQPVTRNGETAREVAGQAPRSAQRPGRRAGNGDGGEGRSRLQARTVGASGI